MNTRTRMPAVTAVLFSAIAMAQVPQKLGYSGRLLRSTGAPETGTVSLKFAVFNAASGGGPLWSETQTLLLSGDGAYSTFLGEAAPLPATLFDGSGARYLELEVNGGAPLSPRQAINSVPYALTARDVKGGTADVTSIKVNGQELISSGRLASQFGYSAGSGVAIDGSNSISLINCASQNQVLAWDTTTGSWKCGSVAGPVGPTGATGLQGVGGPTGAQGATGGTGPAGTPDPTKFIVNGATVQAGASFNIDGNARAGGNVVASGNVQASADVMAYGSSLTTLLNVRAIMNKGFANATCPVGSIAAYVGFSKSRLSGDTLCSLNAGTGVTQHTCAAVKLAYITLGNSLGTWAGGDLACSATVGAPWPWASDSTSVNSADIEWATVTYVVCCK